jgi:hypothetical protein
MDRKDRKIIHAGKRHVSWEYWHIRVWV